MEVQAHLKTPLLCLTNAKYTSTQGYGKGKRSKFDLPVTNFYTSCHHPQISLVGSRGAGQLCKHWAQTSQTAELG